MHAGAETLQEVLMKIKQEVKARQTRFEVSSTRECDTGYVFGDYAFRIRSGKAFTSFEEDGNFSKAIPVAGHVMYLDNKGTITQMVSTDGPLGEGEKRFIRFAGEGNPYITLDGELARALEQAAPDERTPYEMRSVLIPNVGDSSVTSYDFGKMTRKKLGASMFVPLEMFRDYFIDRAKKSLGIKD